MEYLERLIYFLSPRDDIVQLIQMINIDKITTGHSMVVRGAPLTILVASILLCSFYLPLLYKVSSKLIASLGTSRVDLCRPDFLFSENQTYVLDFGSSLAKFVRLMIFGAFSLARPTL